MTARSQSSAPSTFSRDAAADDEALQKAIDRRRDAMVKDALSDWINWLLAFVLPARSTGKAADAADVWEALDARIRSNIDYSNPVLSQLISSERQGLSWAISVHICVCDMARNHRYALFGDAMGFTQSVIAEKVGIRQQRVSELLAQAKRLLAIDLEHRKHVLRSQLNAMKGTANAD